MTLKTLVGSGDKIALLTLPVVVVGVALNLAYPAIFSVGGPAPGLRLLAAALLIPGVIIWAWSVVLILRKVPRGELGAVVGAVMYAGSRLFSGDEEALLASTFGDKWEAYCPRVKIPWL